MPAAEIPVKIARWLPDISRSARRPPQPRVAPSVAPASQVLDWSLCEYSLGGLGCPLCDICALVVGTISVPTLLTTARRRSVLNRVAS